VYLIARGGKMQGRAVRHTQDQYPPVSQYVESAKLRGAADEITQLVDLRNKGVISEEEFQQAKAKALA
jgi:multidrug resistance efflux pump